MSENIQEIGLYIITGTAVILLLFAFIMFMLFMHRNKQLKNRQNIIKLTAEYEKALCESQMEIQEETLRYAGREIHDNIGQILSLAKLNLSSPSEKQVEYAKELISDAIQDIRSLSKALNMDWADNITLGELIEQECYKIEKSGAIAVQFFHQPVPELSAQQKIIVFRVFQECTNNIIKHADARLIKISLSTEGDKLALTVSDDGKGFDINRAEKGSGLNNIHKRIALLKGDINIVSQKGAGTQTEIKIPILD